jgi:divalent metal cation (Fe/Co/Zn/Cd) transporter
MAAPEASWHGTIAVVLTADDARRTVLVRRGLRLIGYAFAGLALYLLIQSTLVLVTGYHPRHSPTGIAWTAITAVAMFALAAGKARTGQELDNPVLRTEARSARSSPTTNS